MGDLFMKGLRFRLNGLVSGLSKLLLLFNDAFKDDLNAWSPFEEESEKFL